MSTSERELILQALHGFISQRSGMEPNNYGSYADYRREQRSVTTDRHHAEKLLGAISWRESITADKLKEALKRGFSGRLTWREPGKEYSHGPGHCAFTPTGKLEYCTGQYFPTEYRKAVAAVCASALWAYIRSSMKDATGPAIRLQARKEFGLEIAKRYFDYRAGDYK